MASSSDEKFDMNICKACKQPFQRLKNHLRQKEDCQREYNMEAFDDQWKTYVRERKSDIVRHIERKHIDMQVACEYCETLFANRYALKNHLKSKHYV